MKATIDLAPSPDVTVHAQGLGNDRNRQSAVDEQDLIERYLPLVRSVVDRIKLNLPTHVCADDLYSVGVTGLIAAVRKFDPDQSGSFSAYAAMRIRGAILDELRRMDWCPRRARMRARKLKHMIDEIEQKLGRAATDAEVALALGLTPREYQKWTDEARPVTFIAIDCACENDDGQDGANLHDLLADDNDRTGRDLLEKAELLELLVSRIDQLPNLPKKILAMYYFENMRGAEIAAVFGLTESRISQIRKETILGLRGWLHRMRNK